jgi:hypothetical protein
MWEERKVAEMRGSHGEYSKFITLLKLVDISESETITAGQISKLVEEKVGHLLSCFCRNIQVKQRGGKEKKLVEWNIK